MPTRNAWRCFSHARALPSPALVLPVLVAAAASPLPSAAQSWGELTREELFATHFEEAPEADAFILHDECTFHVDDKYRLQVSHHRRTKIFTDAGADRAILRIPYRGDEEVKNFRGHTLVPPGTKIAVGKEHMSEERNGNDKVLVIRFPQVAPGVILESSYEIRSNNLATLPPWPFQKEDFVRKSRVDLQLPVGMTYTAFFGGSGSPKPSPVKSEINDPEKIQTKIQQASWTLTNLPPLAETPLVANLEDFRLTLYVQLEAFASTTKKNFKIARSWEELGQEAAKSHKAFLSDAQGVADWARAALPHSADARSQAESLYGFVQREIAVDSAAPSLLSVRGLVAAKRGSPLDRNLLLLHLLRENGIPARPILISTKDHGAFHPRYRSLSQLNHAILEVPCNGEAIYVDTRSRFCPFGTLPPQSRVAQGVLLAEKGGSVIDLAPPAVESKKEIATMAELDPSGDLSCQATLTFTGFEALDAREAIVQTGMEAFLREALTKAFKEVLFESIEEGKPETGATSALVVGARFRVPGYAKRQGYDLTCKFPFAFAPDANPLPPPPRTLPIEFPYSSTWEETVNLKLPADHVLSGKLPQGSSSIDAAAFSTLHEVHNLMVEGKRRFQIRESKIKETQYDALRQLYDKLVSTHDVEFLVRRQTMQSNSAG
jgi:hypothetical protein